MNEPLVSIGLPTYNRAKDLRFCLANLTSLNYKNFEIIVSDNHSTDATEKVCKEFIKRDARIHYYRQKTNLGVNSNSLFVLEKAKGKYFVLMSDDDVRDNSCLTKLIPLLEKNPKATSAITGTTLFTKDSSFSIPIYFKPISDPISSIFTYLFHPECVSVLLYGVHRRTESFINNFRLVMAEKRPFGVMGYDDSLTVFLLLQGDLIYLPENLFYIRDNGMYISVYRTLSNAKISRIFVKKVSRYLLFPVMFLYDWYYGCLHVLRSKIRFYLKPLIIIAITGKLLYDDILFVFSIVKAIAVFTVGLMKKLFSFPASEK